MKAVLQRVSQARLEVDGAERARIDAPPDGNGGLVVLVGLEHDDTAADRAWMADKVVNLRIFADEQGKMNRSVAETGGTILLVPNFTLAGEARKGRRPSFDSAMKPPEAETDFASLVGEVRGMHGRVEQGVFGAHMLVTLTNDGPVTITLDSRAGR